MNYLDGWIACACKHHPSSAQFTRAATNNERSFDKASDDRSINSINSNIRQAIEEVTVDCVTNGYADAGRVQQEGVLALRDYWSLRGGRHAAAPHAGRSATSRGGGDWDCIDESRRSRGSSSPGGSSVRQQNKQVTATSSGDNST
jgi:hypothetical protein